MRPVLPHCKPVTGLAEKVPTLRHNTRLRPTMRLSDDRQKPPSTPTRSPHVPARCSCAGWSRHRPEPTTSAMSPARRSNQPPAAGTSAPTCLENPPSSCPISAACRPMSKNVRPSSPTAMKVSGLAPGERAKPISQALR